MSTNVISRTTSQAINNTHLVPYVVTHPFMKTHQMLKHLNGTMHQPLKHKVRGVTPMRGVGFLSASLAESSLQLSVARPRVSYNPPITGNLLTTQPQIMAQPMTTNPQMGSSGQPDPTSDASIPSDAQLSMVPPQLSSISQMPTVGNPPTTEIDETAAHNED